MGRSDGDLEPSNRDGASRHDLDAGLDLPGGWEDGPGGNGMLETVDLGSTKRPWVAYVVVAVLVLAGSGLGVRHLLSGSSHPQVAAPSAPIAHSSRSVTASSPTTSSPASSSPDRHSFVATKDSHLPAVGPSVGYAELGTSALTSPTSCLHTHRLLGLRPGESPAAMHPQSVLAHCEAIPAGVSVVVRAVHGGEFASHSAVVMYTSAPVDAGRSTVATHDGKRGRWTSSGVSWKVPGGYLWVSGDLPRAELARIALASSVPTSLEGPNDPPLSVASMHGYRTGAPVPVLGPAQYAATYSARSLGLARSPTRRTVSVGVASGSLDEAFAYLYGGTSVRHVRIAGRPGVEVGDGSSGQLGIYWQLAPDLDASVGCMPCAPTAALRGYLVRLANGAELYSLHLTPAKD